MDRELSPMVDHSMIEHLLARAVRQTQNAVVITDVHGAIVWVNAGFTHISGYTLEEAIGRKPGRLLQGPETNRADVARIRAAIEARQAVNLELVNYHKDGTPYWIGMKIEPLLGEDGRADGFMAIQDDITERRRRREELEVLHRRFSTATHTARVGVFERSAKSMEIWWNDVLYEIYGQDPDTFTPTSESVSCLIHADDRGQFFAQRSSLEAYTVRFRILRPDGSIRHLERIAGSRRSFDENLVGIILDVTDRVQAEERERALQEQLRVVSHQAGMAEIATGVLHNVGNVLNSLGIANSTLRTHVKSQRLERLAKAAEMLREKRAELSQFLTQDPHGKHLPDYLCALSAQIADAARTMHAELDTVEDLLQHLRNVVGAQQSVAETRAATEPVKLQQMIDTALSLDPPADQIRVLRTYEDLPPVVTDRHKLLQILINLVNNARDAVYAADVNSGRIAVRLYRENQHAVISVEDNGVGMSAEVLAHLWQFGFTTKRNGHGFGLHNCANSAKEIAATLDAYSAGANQGARFDLRLPLYTAA